MKRTIISLFLLVFIAASGATAQSPKPNQCPQVGRTYQRLLPTADTPTVAEQQLAQHKAAQQKEQQFWMKTEKFIDSWTALAREYNDKGTFNVKRAKEVSKAFHDLEKSEGWPQTDHR
jgi:hypothetical protein